jgi:hypothetical protein
MAMVASHMIWLLRTKGIRKRAKEAGQTFDQSEEGSQWESKGVDLETKFRNLFTRNRPLLNGSDFRSDGTDVLVAPEHIVTKTVPNAMI